MRLTELDTRLKPFCAIRWSGYRYISYRSRPFRSTSTHEPVSSNETKDTKGFRKSEVERQWQESRGHTEVWLPLKRLRNPYSFPDSPIYQRLSRRRQRMKVVEMASSEAPESSWNSQQATRPLLLTLDAFDTIFTPKTSVASQYCEVASKYGIEVSEESVQESFRKAFKAVSKSSPNYGKEKNMHYQTWWEQVIEKTIEPLLVGSTQSKAGVPKDLIAELYTRFSSDEGYRLFDDVMHFLAAVGTSYQASKWAPRRIMLGILSNSDPRVREILSSFSIDISPRLFPPRYTPNKRMEIYKFGPASFAFATLSYECGHSKPSRMIFDAAERNAQSAFDATSDAERLTRSGLSLLDDVRMEFHHMHVGDDIDKDVLPALKCGWDAVLLDRNAEQEISTRDVEGQQVTVIKDLLALRHVVTKDRLELEDGTPRQAPVWIDESKPIERTSAFRTHELKGQAVVRHKQSLQGYPPLQTLD